MKVFMTGATGVVGRLTVPALVAAGHEVRAVSRRDAAASGLRAAGAEPVTADLFDADAVASAVSGCDTVIHLATNVPTLGKAGRPKGWEMHNQLRTAATDNLVAAARAAGATRFVKESVTFVYRDGADMWLDETAPLIPDLGLLASTIDGEERALAFAAAGGTTTILRFGLFYGGAGNRGTTDALKLARFRRSSIAGSPDAFMASIHAEDVATAVVAALGASSGVYNVVDDEPMRRRDYLAAFATAFGVKPPKPIPARLMRLGGGSAADGLAASQRVSNRKFENETGWAPRYPSARTGWAAVGAEYQEENR